MRDGSRNGAFTDMDTVGRIEVINGPSAAEGIGAAGGIINYISKSPTEDGTQVSVTHAFRLAVRQRQRQLESRASTSRTSTTTSTCCSPARSPTAASPTTATAAASA